MQGAIVRKFASEKLTQYAGRIQVCLGKLTAEQIWARHSKNENAVGNLVLHLCGNVRQWIGTGVAGLPDIRRRDDEFAAHGGMEAAALGALLEAITSDAAAQIEAVPDARLEERAQIQNYNVTRLEAILHVLAHFGEHTGQIIFATKLLTGEDLGFYAHLKKASHGETVP